MTKLATQIVAWMVAGAVWGTSGRAEHHQKDVRSLSQVASWCLPPFFALLLFCLFCLEAKVASLSDEATRNGPNRHISWLSEYHETRSTTRFLGLPKNIAPCTIASRMEPPRPKLRNKPNNYITIKEAKQQKLITEKEKQQVTSASTKDKANQKGFANETIL